MVEKTIYRGPNRYGYGRGISAVVDLGDLEEEPSKKIDNFNDNLLSLIPSLQKHTCSYDEPGGFVRRLTEEEGTWLGHVFEHVAIEIQNLAGVNVSYGKTRQITDVIGRSGKTSVYRVYFEFKNEETALASMNLALRVVNALVDPDLVVDFDYQAELIEVIETAEEHAFGPSTGSIVQEAQDRGIPYIRLRKSSSLVQFGWGKNQKRIWASTSTASSYISVEIAQDKELTLQMLYDVGIPVPRGGTARQLGTALKEVYRIGFPVVVKPLDVSHGRGISLNLKTEEEVISAFELAKEYSRTVIVEKHIIGKDYRILVINGVFVAAANRVPARVVGDGKNTVRELVNLTNQDPRRGIGHEKVLTQIKINDSAIQLLESQGHSLDSIPQKDEKVQLVATGNLSTGGTAIDVSDIIHYENIKLAERAVKTLGLDIAGVDIIAPDISKPIKQHGGAIVEINAAPGLRMHLEPTEGKKTNVAKPIIDMLFADGSDGRIPLISITGTNGKTTTSRWIAHTLKLAGYKVGLTTTDGIYIDGDLEYVGDCTGPWSAKVVLRDPTVDFAVLETARGGILREGLGWDLCDVGVLLNVSDDHLGQKGVSDLSDLAEIKGVVLDQIQPNGLGVLNADDPHVMNQMDRVDARIALVSLDHKNPKFLRHIDEGGTGVTVTPNGIIQLWKRNSQTPIAHVRDIPATFRGKAIFNVQNAMFVVASLSNFISVTDIQTGLSTFYTDRNQTPGRMNVERINGARIIIDYGHNLEAFKSQIQLVNGIMNEQGEIGRKAIVFGLPGDRQDESLIQAVNILIGEYDRYFIKEDWRLRGRSPGEVPKLIKKTLMKGGVNEDQIEIYYGPQTELDAITSMYNWIKSNDVILLQADDIKQVQEHLYLKLANINNLSLASNLSQTSSSEDLEYDFSKEVKYIEDDFSD